MRKVHYAKGGVLDDDSPYAQAVDSVSECRPIASPPRHPRMMRVTTLTYTVTCKKCKAILDKERLSKL